MRVGLAQFTPVLSDKWKNANRMAEYLREAKMQKADIVLFPELALTGYSIGCELEEQAESVEGETLTFLRSVCRELAIHSVISFPEKKEGSYYISSALIDDEGGIAGVYRKTHLFGEEAASFKRGDCWPVFETKLGRIGVMICYDLEFPEVARLLRLQRADLILVNTANMTPYERYQTVYMQSRAMENEIPIAICNRLGMEGDLHFFGNSMAVDGKGHVLIDMQSEETFRTVDVPLGKEHDPDLAYAENLHPRMKNSLKSCL
ncbi:carbon-nitrogen hydrolase family protein [Bacillus sp. 1P06AnD]|uniref:carbon-nitrogen hydrolase family protein n=1 Tax=Bacillus sp. 1P06AnD TaxID=3132208 RepID=UPI0039A2C8C4